MKPQRERERVDRKSRIGIVWKNIQVGNNGGIHRFWLWRENGEVWDNSKNGINPEGKLDFLYIRYVFNLFIFHIMLLIKI